MSKNTGANVFRKVDVDQYNEDNYQDEPVEDDQDQGPNENEVQSLLNAKKNVEALQYVIANAPVRTKSQSTKDKALNSVMRVLSVFKSSEIDKAVNSLSQPEVDVLMKYIYKGFANTNENQSAILLTWFGKVTAKGGLGCIVRVLTDRK